MPNPYRRTLPPKVTVVDAPAAPAPPVQVEPLPQVIVRREDATRRALALLSAGMLDTADVERRLVDEFELDPADARLVLEDVFRKVRDQLDNEGLIDLAMLTTVAKASLLAETFFKQATEPIPDRVVDVLGADPDDPMKGAVLRPLTPAELSAFTGARVQAGKLALAAHGTIAQVVGRRSTRWAPKPDQVAVQVNVGTGLSEEDRDLLRKLGMAGPEWRISVYVLGVLHQRGHRAVHPHRRHAHRRPALSLPVADRRVHPRVAHRHGRGGSELRVRSGERHGPPAHRRGGRGHHRYGDARGALVTTTVTLFNRPLDIGEVLVSSAEKEGKPLRLATHATTTPGVWVGGGLNGRPGRGGPARRLWLDGEGGHLRDDTGSPLVAASVHAVGKDNLWTLEVKAPDGRGAVWTGAFVGTENETARTRAMARADEMLRVLLMQMEGHHA